MNSLLPVYTKSLPVGRNIFVYLVVLVFLLLQSCAPVDDTTITITHPEHGTRFTALPEGGLIPVRIRVDSTFSKHPQKATLCVADECTTCLAEIGQEITCVLIRPVVSEEYQLVASVDKDSGETVIDRVVFSWKPYSLLERVSLMAARIVGQESLAVGYFVICLSIALSVLVTYIFAIYLPKRRARRGPEIVTFQVPKVDPYDELSSHKGNADKDEAYLYTGRGTYHSPDKSNPDIIEGKVIS